MPDEHQYISGKFGQQRLTLAHTSSSICLGDLLCYMGEGRDKTPLERKSGYNEFVKHL